MYGLGYGLSKMVEGATTGLVEQKRYDETKAIREADRAAVMDYRNKDLALRERQMTEQEQAAKTARTAGALKSYMEAFEKTGDKEFAQRVFKVYDPEGMVPDVAVIGKDEVEVAVPGLKIKGKKKAIEQAIELIGKNPGRAQEILGQLNQLGLAKIEVTEGKEKEDKLYEVGPGNSLVDKSGKVVFKAPEKAGKDTAPQMSDYGTYITKIFNKYKMGDTGFSVDANGQVKVDLTKFFGSQQSAYDVLKGKAKTDKEAAQDLADLTEAYGKMKSILGIGAPAAEPATPGTLGGMVPGATGPAAGTPATMAGMWAGKTGADQSTTRGATPAAAGTPGQKKKAVFDPTTGRFIYK